jgi:thioredoxin reductase
MLRAYLTMVRRHHKEIKGNDKVEALGGANDKMLEERKIAIDWMIICVGTEPNTKVAQEAGIEMEGKFVKGDNQMRTNREGIFACGEIISGHRHLITSASEGASAGMAASEYLALENVRKGEMFEGDRNGKYADEFLAMLS